MLHRPRHETPRALRPHRLALVGVAALMLSAAACDVGTSILPPRTDAGSNDSPALDAPVLDVPAGGDAADVASADAAMDDRSDADVSATDAASSGDVGDAPATDAPAADVAADAPGPDAPADVSVIDGPAPDATSTRPPCGAVLMDAYGACVGTLATFVSCLRGFAPPGTFWPPGSPDAVAYDNYVNCIAGTCGPAPAASCVATRCYNEALACLPTHCSFAAACAFACASADCRASYDECSRPLSTAHRADFDALRGCLVRACGATLAASCVERSMPMCSAEGAACGYAVVTDGGAPTDAPAGG